MENIELSHVGYALHYSMNYNSKSSPRTIFFKHAMTESEIIHLLDHRKVVKDVDFADFRKGRREIEKYVRKESSFGIGLRFAYYALYSETPVPFEVDTNIEFPIENVYGKKLFEHFYSPEELLEKLPSKRLKTLFA